MPCGHAISTNPPCRSIECQRIARRQHRPAAPSHARRAFTLIEIVATIVVLSIIGSIASKTLLSAMDGYMRASTQAQLHSELSISMERIEREFRKIPIKASYGSIAPNITSVTASSIAWTSGGSYSLSLSGSQLMIVDNGATSAVLQDDITAFAVQTYNESNTALGASLSGTGCDPIRRISIQITAQRAGITEVLRGRFYLRCTMDGASS